LDIIVSFLFTFLAQTLRNRCRSRQFAGVAKDIFPEFPQIFPKNVHTTNFLQIFCSCWYNVAIDLNLENVLQEIWFLITQLKQRMLDCARTVSEVSCHISLHWTSASQF